MGLAGPPPRTVASLRGVRASAGAGGRAPRLTGMPTIELNWRVVTYDEAGPARPDRPPLLLLHGFTGGRQDFADVLESLGEDRRVVVVDLPGHGDSEGSDDTAAYGLASTAAWVAQFADAVALGDFHLLGHSLGGLIAQRVAAGASQRLRSLVLMDTGLGAPREEPAERVVRIALAARDEGPEAAAAASLDDASASDEERAEATARFRALNPAAVVGAARGLVHAVPLSAFLRGIDVPVLVLHGEQDETWTLSEQRLLAATVAGAEHVVIPAAAHSPQRENPEAWLAALRGFLRRVDETASGG